MIFIISFDTTEASTRERIINKINGLGEACQYMPGAFFVASSTLDNANSIYEHLRKDMADGDRVFITKLDKNNMMGWLNSTAVDWLGKHS